MNNFFTVEGIIKIYGPTANKKIKFVVTVIEYTSSAVMNAISNNQELISEINGKNKIRFIIKNIQEKIFEDHLIQ